MTNPKSPKLDKTSSGKGPPDKTSEDTDKLALQQLVRLADSVEALVRQQSTGAATTAAAAPTAEVERSKAEFAYLFLNQLLVRGAINGDLLEGQLIQAPPADVVRDKRGLTFRALGGATEARVQVDRTVLVLTPLRENVPVRPGNIQDDQTIDSILLVNNDGVPISIALNVEIV